MYFCNCKIIFANRTHILLLLSSFSLRKASFSINANSFNYIYDEQSISKYGILNRNRNIMLIVDIRNNNTIPI